MLHELTSRDKVIWVKGLMNACPLYADLPDCPFGKYRPLPTPEKFKLADTMTEVEIDNLINHHQECLAHREQGT